MKSLKMLNAGCGAKTNPAWTNIDFSAKHPDVLIHNILKGLPYPDNYFDAIYHSHFLEHLSKSDAHGFTVECFRVLKPGGIIRIVVPDLENIAREYLTQLERYLESPTPESLADYEWIVIELMDQTTRNKSGGEMLKNLSNPSISNFDYVRGRIGKVAKITRDNALNSCTKPKSARDYIKRAASNLYHRLPLREARKVGNFRMKGENHLWMYDRVSLSLLLKRNGFIAIEEKAYDTSEIENWNQYELDAKDGEAVDPTSLFMEAKK
jgi:predicted SAM-dependent methyltransferase